MCRTFFKCFFLSAGGGSGGGAAYQRLWGLRIDFGGFQRLHKSIRKQDETKT
jgi:hypothetical protein